MPATKIHATEYKLVESQTHSKIMNSSILSPNILPNRVICLGAANIDVRCAFDNNAIDGTSNPAAISQSTGGAALNTARILAANGCNTRFIGLVGDDDDAHQVANALRDSNVENGLVHLTGHSTGKYISMLEPDGTLKIACNDMKIHQEFSTDLLDKQFANQALEDYSALYCDANIPEQALKRAFQMMHQLTPGALKCATTVSTAKAQRLSASLELIDVLFTNKSEAAALLGLNNKDASTNHLADSLASLPIKSGIISDGSNPLFYWANDGVQSIDIPPVSEIVDVVGAGDALAAGTIAALVKGDNLSNAVRAGIVSAQKVLMVDGAFSARFA